VWPVRVPFRLVDVFAEAPFGGNQLCVVPEVPDGLDGATMQALALEIGFSETTFVTAIGADGYDVRIFAPEDELPFAGHPTLGTAFTLAREGLIGTDVIQHCGAGDVPVWIDLEAGRATMRQLPSVVGSEVEDRAAVAAAAGLNAGDLIDALPIVPISTGIAHTMVPIRDDDALRRAVRDDRGCARICEQIDAESLYLFTVRGDGDVRARMFDKGSTIGEDPATGSGAGPLGAYLAMHGLAGLPGTVVIAQGEQVGRPSFLHVEVAPNGDSWSIEVGGGVRPMGDGAFEI
jgi:trans-2,3-dihydro-3-hydroxyanthranilate isomerase